MQLQKPQTIEATVTATMPLSDWQQLEELLPSEWPAGDFKAAIRSAIHDANRIFYGEKIAP